jgi:EmrB/QacA subfamily drug resistance transporter
VTEPPDRTAAMALHPAGRARRDEVVVEAPGVDEVVVAPWPLLYRIQRRLRQRSVPSNRWAVLAVVLVGLFTVSVTITLLAVSLVDIAKDLDTTTSTIAWIITAPMLAFGVIGPAAGKAGDLFGYKRVFCIGLFGAGVFALATAFSWSAGSLIMFRTLSAGFGSATGPAAMALINRMFDSDERVRALGYWSFVSAGAPVIGVVAGGPLVELVGWRVIFLVQAPLCAVGFLVALLLLPETERGEQSRFDWAGAVLLGVSVTALLLGVNRGGVWGWTSPGVLAAFVVCPLALAAFVAVERRTPEPLVPLGWLRERNVVGPVGSQTLMNFAYMGGFILTPVLLEEGLGYGTAAVGLLIIARPLAFSLTAPTASVVTVRVGERVAGVTGAVVVAASMVVLALVGVGTPAWVIVLGLALSGIGLGMSSPAMTATVANAVDETDLGVAAAMQQLMTQVGAVIGVQVMQTVQAVTEGSSGYVQSFGNAYLVGAVVCVLGACAALVIQPSDRPAEDEVELATAR